MKTRSTPPGGGLGRRRPPPRKIAREAMLEESRKGVSHDLFDAPPPSGSGLVDLSDMAHSEPPESLASRAPAPAAPSSAPPLDLLAHPEGPELARSGEDVDFLLGLTGSQGSTAALASPTLADLARKAPSDPPPSQPMPQESEATQPAARVYVPKKPGATSKPANEKKKGGGLGWVLVAGALAAGAVAFALSSRKAEIRNPEVAQNTAASPELERPQTAEPAPVAPSQPAPSAELAEAPLEIASANPSAASAQAAAPTHAAAASAAVKEKSNAQAKPSQAGASEPSAAAAEVEPKAPSLPKPPAAAAGTPFDRSAAASALATAAAQASACRKEGDPSGVANVTLTFAPSGRVTTAKLSGPPFAGTATGGCIASTLRRAKIPPFDGDLVTVSKTIVVQ
ncbi:MAG TPA: hypothetical protein VG937_25905 [Polyangiaceae bacterium]|nr:hypothetical protein [Polyangiaceae bacterium]